MIREKSKCSLCPLNGRRKCSSQGPSSAGNGVAILGEAPGLAEDERGVPFCGPSGRLLNLAIANLKLSRGAFYVTNVIACRPPDNDITTHEGWEAVQCCKSGLKAELEEMRRNGVKVILALGQTAMEALGIEGRVSKNRGSVYKMDGFYVIPTYHPSFLLRSGGKRGTDGVNLIAAFTSDLQKAVTISREGWTPPEETFILQPTLEDVRKFVDDAIRDKVEVALDIETTGLDARRGAKVVVVGLARDAEHAIVVPMLAEHGKNYWGSDEEPVVKMLLEKLFANNPLLLQNCFFDIPFLRACGWNISVDNVAHDTLVVHSLVSPETEHNLGYIVSVYGQTPQWKEAFKNREVPILEMDQLEMRRYNARDCVVLHQVIGPMLDQLEEYGLKDFYETETKPLMRPFMEMVESGVGFDFKHMQAFSAKMDQLINEKETAIRSMWKLPKSFNFDSDDELRWLLFGQRPGKFSQLVSTLVTYEKELKSGVKKDTRLFEGVTSVPVDAVPGGRILSQEVVKTLDHKRPSKAREALEGLAEIAEMELPYHLPAFKGLQTDGGKIKVSKDGLLSYRIALQNRLEVLDGLKTPKPEEAEAIQDVMYLIELLNSYGEFSKLKTSFTSYMPHSDNRIRPSWLMHGTATGRLSCKSPNLAQLPSRGEGKDIRKFFVARDGWSMIDADFENLEVALLGYVANDPVIIDIYESGKNIHDENTIILFGLPRPPFTEEDPEWAEWKKTPEGVTWTDARKAAKVFQFGGLSYGGGDREIYKKVLMQAPKMPLTFAHFVEAKENWMKAHPAYVEWRKGVTEEVLAKRRLYTPFGRMRIFLGHPRDIVKEGMNFMIQGTGANVTNRAMIRLYDRFKADRMETKLIMQVYDEIVLEAPDDEAPIAARMLAEEMSRPFEIYGRKCMVRASSGIGKNYGEAK